MDGSIQKFLKLWSGASLVSLVQGPSLHHGFFDLIGRGVVIGLISAACIFKWAKIVESKQMGLDVGEEWKVERAIVLAFVLTGVSVFWLN